MNERTLWQKFILSGSVVDYLKFTDCRNKEYTEVTDNAFFDRCTGYSGKEYRGE